MKFKDYYKALGVDRSATEQEIKQAYRKLAHKYHPDISKDPQGEAKFKEVAEAYAILKDPEKREEYDRLGRRPAGQSFTPPPDWGQQFGGGASAFDDTDMSDFFSAFTSARRGGARGRRTTPTPGQDYEVSTSISLEQVIHGGEIDVRVELPEHDRPGMPRNVPRTFRVTVPKGVTDGYKLRLAGKGGQGAHGGKPGDLYLTLQIEAHPFYRVNGRDLSIDLPLAPWEAALGAAVQIPTPGGTVEMQIKPGTTAGRRLRLAKRGLPGIDGSVGDLYADVRIDVPQTVNSHERALFEQLAKVSNFNPRQHLDDASRK